MSHGKGEKNETRPCCDLHHFTLRKGEREKTKGKPVTEMLRTKKFKRGREGDTGRLKRFRNKWECPPRAKNGPSRGIGVKIRLPEQKRFKENKRGGRKEGEGGFLTKTLVAKGWRSAEPH